MRFKIYLRRFGRLIKLYKLHRTTEGLYVISSKSLGTGDHISYHEDGKFWDKFHGQRIIKKLRQPLSSFTGTESLISAFCTVLNPMAEDLDETEVNLKPEDIVLDRKGSFGIEIILSETRVELPELPDRLNSAIYVKEQCKPLLIIEAFEMKDNVLSAARFTSGQEWVEGDNFFLNHVGKI